MPWWGWLIIGLAALSITKVFIRKHLKKKKEAQKKFTDED